MNAQTAGDPGDRFRTIREFKSRRPHQAPTSNPFAISRVEENETSQDIYQYERRFRLAKRNLELSKVVLPANRQLILEFVEQLILSGISKARVTKYLLHLTTLARYAKNSFRRYRRRDVERLVGWIDSQNYTEHTAHDCRVILKRFFQSLRGSDVAEHEYPDEVKWIKTTLRRNRILPEALARV